MIIFMEDDLERANNMKPKNHFHKSELFCYGAAKGSLAMFMFSFFEYLKNKTITQATVANVLQHNQLNVAFRRVFTISLADRRDTMLDFVPIWNINNIPFSKKKLMSGYREMVTHIESVNAFLPVANARVVAIDLASFLVMSAADF
ncbi:hypothetical protein ACJX0J_014905, partial [Zea mays]